jgi:hypothetical protein
MGNPNSCFRHLQDVLWWVLGGSSAPEVPVAASAGERAGGSCAPRVGAGTASTVEGAESGTGSRVAQQIQDSMRHWSQLADTNLMSLENYDAIDAENREVFQELQSHPQWGHFFKTFGYSLGIRRSYGELVVGEKFAEGGQAELFHAHVTWWNPESNEEDQEKGFEWVLKVFKKGTLLRQLQSQWSEGFLKLRVKVIFPQIIHYCPIDCGILLEDGRFAFLLRRQHEDLRSFIDWKMLSIGQDCGPFSKDIAESFMYGIALGMEFLHGQNIVHRDLKASNVLYSEYEEMREESWSCVVSDFECSVGVVGTGFFRAPEILQACKEKNVSQRPELFTKKVDVSSYGMTCYEILTGKLPFEEHSIHEYDLVLQGQWPVVPKYVDNWAHDLLSRCWYFDPSARPSFGEILDLLLLNSAAVRELVERRRGYQTFKHNRLKKITEY